jgi:hypothetical protein
MDIQDIRRANLMRWLERNSVPPKEKSLFSQLKGGASFGERVARRLEADYGMGVGFLDADEASNSSNKGQNPVLSDEANRLIQCVMRLDGRGKEVRQTFAYTLGILEIVERLGSVQDADVASEPAEQEVIRLLEETHARPTRVPKHAARKHK